jgi:hypothetical protein
MKQDPVSIAGAGVERGAGMAVQTRALIGSLFAISSHLILSNLNSSAGARSKEKKFDAMRYPKEIR